MNAQMAEDAARLGLSGRVREVVLGRILDGTYKPGERVIELRIAEEFHISQAPVREAFRDLQGLGVLEISRNRGTCVSAPDLAEIAEIYDVRAEIEGYAASLAVQAKWRDVTELQRLVTEMVTHGRRGDVHRFAEANALFHRTIVEASGNKTLLDIWLRLDVRSRSMVNIVRAGRDLIATANSHNDVIAAVLSGSPAQARRKLRAHIAEYRPSLVPSVERS
jgi:DNA-binding GntR family transcriptional regulator